MNLFKKIFKKKNPVFSEVKPKEEIKLKNISELKQFDDIWVKIDDNVFEGWIVERVGNTVAVVYSDTNKKLQDAHFLIERPLDRTTIEQNNKTLIINKIEAI